MLLIGNAQGHLKSQGKLTRTSGNFFKNLEFMFAFENKVWKILSSLNSQNLLKSEVGSPLLWRSLQFRKPSSSQIMIIQDFDPEPRYHEEGRM